MRRGPQGEVRSIVVKCGVEQGDHNIFSRGHGPAVNEPLTDGHQARIKDTELFPIHLCTQAAAKHPQTHHARKSIKQPSKYQAKHN